MRAAPIARGQLALAVVHASLCPPCLAGDNYYGQVYSGTTNYVTTPTAVTGSVSSWTAISAGGKHTCGLAAGNGAAYCWGEALCIFEAHCKLCTSTTAAYSTSRAALLACGPWCVHHSARRASQATISTGRSVTEPLALP